MYTCLYYSRRNYRLVFFSRSSPARAHSESSCSNQGLLISSLSMTCSEWSMYQSRCSMWLGKLRQVVWLRHRHQSNARHKSSTIQKRMWRLGKFWKNLRKRCSIQSLWACVPLFMVLGQQAVHCALCVLSHQTQSHTVPHHPTPTCMTESLLFFFGVLWCSLLSLSTLDVLMYVCVCVRMSFHQGQQKSRGLNVICQSVPQTSWTTQKSDKRQAPVRTVMTMSGLCLEVWAASLQQANALEFDDLSFRSTPRNAAVMSQKKNPCGTVKNWWWWWWWWWKVRTAFSGLLFLECLWLFWQIAFIYFSNFVTHRYQLLTNSERKLFHYKKGSDFGVVHCKMRCGTSRIMPQFEIKDHYKKTCDKYHGFYWYKLPGHKLKILVKILLTSGVPFSGFDRRGIL